VQSLKNILLNMGIEYDSSKQIDEELAVICHKILDL
jgi:hypothetical protein